MFVAAVVLMLATVPTQKIAQSPSVSQRNSISEVKAAEPQQTRVNSAKTPETYWEQVGKPEVLPIWVGSFGTLIACIIGIITLLMISQQTKAAIIAANAARDSADAYMATERPFILVEPRGEDFVEFWAVNHGKSPAHVVFCRSAPIVDAPKLDRENDTLNYGSGFDNPNLEAINVPWIPPNGEMSLGTFSSSLLEEFGKTVLDELRTAQRVLLIYSAIKYRGIDGDKTYTTTFCYRRFNGKLTMWGAYGWNKCT